MLFLDSTFGPVQLQTAESALEQIELLLAVFEMPAWLPQPLRLAVRVLQSPLNRASFLAKTECNFAGQFWFWSHVLPFVEL